MQLKNNISKTKIETLYIIINFFIKKYKITMFEWI